MKTITTIISVAMLLAGCASSAPTGEPEVNRNRVRECPPDMIQICETRQGRASSGSDEEIPEYEYCYCEPYPR